MADYAETIAKLKDQLNCAETVMRLEAENERLKIELAAMRGAANSYKAEVERLQAETEEQDQAIINALHRMGEIRVEAVREFAEKLKATPLRFRVDHIRLINEPPESKMVLFVDDSDIDNLIKEMEK